MSSLSCHFDPLHPHLTSLFAFPATEKLSEYHHIKILPVVQSIRQPIWNADISFKVYFPFSMKWKKEKLLLNFQFSLAGKTQWKCNFFWHIIVSRLIAISLTHESWMLRKCFWFSFRSIEVTPSLCKRDRRSRIWGERTTISIIEGGAIKSDSE